MTLRRKNSHGAFSLSPDDPKVLTPYIAFLREVREDEARAKELEQRLSGSAQGTH
jgi:hypothetical protein